MAAVVVSYQSAATIDDCLIRLRAAEGVVAIRVVDNHSSDGTLEIVQRHAAGDARVRFIDNPDNPGFGVGCNQGVADLGAVRAPWLAFVNPDCLLEPEALARLRALAQPLGAALLGADLVDDEGERDGAARRNDPDFAAMLAAALRFSSPPPMNLEPDDTQALQRVQAVSGALMLMPRALYAHLGGFDEGYRLHAEDLDLCRRAREAGAAVAVANHVRVLHVRGVSSRSRPLFVEWHKHRGLWRYFRKFEYGRRGVWTRMGVFAAIWLRFPVAAVRAWLR
ncbi:glycosyltransferase family 2 protein [Lysobacter silvisoli]|uniref:Glycosyltransferase family 2 protein n=1 Tax=Lysobacter silvisoli TaxID=2293254 RepID=A0A371K0X0_9GAMM|nr:glycosyltransferase family 2 protein [Lysobacter silvisoli]